MSNQLAYWAVFTQAANDHTMALPVQAASDADACSIAGVIYGDRLVAVTVEDYQEDSIPVRVLFDRRNFHTAQAGQLWLHNASKNAGYRERSLARVDLHFEGPDGSIHIFDETGEEIVMWDSQEWIDDPSVVFAIASLMESFRLHGADEVKRRVDYKGENALEPLAVLDNLVQYPMRRLDTVF